MADLKQVILVRKDLKLTKGKMSAQVAHASVGAVLKSDKTLVTSWDKQGMPKIVLAVENKTELLAYKRKAEAAGLVTALITDAGHTHLEPGTSTCLAIGPDEDAKIDAVTGGLKLIS